MPFSVIFFLGRGADFTLVIFNFPDLRSRFGVNKHRLERNTEMLPALVKGLTQQNTLMFQAQIESISEKI